MTHIPAKLAPSAEQRAAIEARIKSLRSAASFIDIDVSMAEVTKLLLAMPGAQVSDAGATARGQAYIIAIDDLPSFAVIEACRRWLRGEAGLIGEGKEARAPNYAYAPTPPELRLVAAPIARLVLHQAERLHTLLDAKVISDRSAA